MIRKRLNLGELRVDTFEPLSTPEATPLNQLNTCTGQPQLCSKCCIEATCTDCQDCN